MSDSADISFLPRATWAVPSAPREVAGVRARAVAEVRALGIPIEDTTDLELVVTELVTNAIRHGGGSEVHIHLRLHGPGILAVEVHDRSRQYPDGPPAAGEDQESGRGLHIVDTLALRWGFLEFPHHKAAWAHLAVPPGTAPPACAAARRPAAIPRPAAGPDRNGGAEPGTDPGAGRFARRFARVRTARSGTRFPWPGPTTGAAVPRSPRVRRRTGTEHDPARPALAR
ncbi:ATP-binding protein [Kitasatospora sp. NBC_00240]|uniref:ATP-binding protein n=1 Tax=Kitasatospora sp. NBC_00240 TaxID=2903567 RepID=UPI00224FA958|nr:ATP-binding protein [Kitasatospora sp. NBC_00240]MCX5209430.1 ATP-binding protein [Kitasatospora sp. NBC_00240]